MALRMVSLANALQTFWWRAGRSTSVVIRKLITAEFWHGQNGLANIELPKSKCKADPPLGAGPDYRDGACESAHEDYFGAPLGR